MKIKDVRLIVVRDLNDDGGFDVTFRWLVGSTLVSMPVAIPLAKLPTIIADLQEEWRSANYLLARNAAAQKVGRGVSIPRQTNGT